MVLAGYIILALVCFMGSYIVYVYIHAWRQTGGPAPETGSSGESAPRVLYYFHSPGCGNCRSMKPIITELAAQYDNLIVIDISQDIDIARKFEVRATPTMILVERGEIIKVLLGTQSRKKIESLLARPQFPG